MKHSMLDIKPAELKIRLRQVSTHCPDCDMPFDEQGSPVDRIYFAGINQHGTNFGISSENIKSITLHYESDILEDQTTKIENMEISVYSGWKNFVMHPWDMGECTVEMVGGDRKDCPICNPPKED